MGLFVSDLNSTGGIRVGGEAREVALECLDDASDPLRCAEIYRSLCCEHRVDVVLGPYSSQLTRVAAPIAEQAGMLFVNHGGAADDLYSHNRRLMVGVLSPASDYFDRIRAAGRGAEVMAQARRDRSLPERLRGRRGPMASSEQAKTATRGERACAFG